MIRSNNELFDLSMPFRKYKELHFLDVLKKYNQYLKININ